MKKIATPLFALGALAAISAAAEAHTGHAETSGFIHGFLHPFSGADHLLAMVAVGAIAATIGGMARWLVPAAFLTMMVLGGIAGASGLQLPWVELGIAASLVAFGAVMASDLRLPLVLAMALTGFFAIFHGFAHGAEIPADADGISYGLGFTLATAVLHAAGLGLGLAVMWISSVRLLRLSGGALSVAGLALLFGLI